MKKLERQIQKAEAEAAATSAELADPANYEDHAKIRELADALDSANSAPTNCLPNGSRRSPDSKSPISTH